MKVQGCDRNVTLNHNGYSLKEDGALEVLICALCNRLGSMTITVEK